MSPSPEEIRTVRRISRLTQAEAAALVHAAHRTYQDWEAGKAPMHPGLWELFTIKLNNSLSRSPARPAAPTVRIRRKHDASPA